MRDAAPTTCPGCRAALPENARFCPACGRRLAEDPARRYVPTEVMDKLDAAGGSSRTGGLEAERRVVTILFCDVKGSTTIAEELDPEDWAEVMNGVFEQLIEPIHRYEGTLARLMGDAINLAARMEQTAQPGTVQIAAETHRLVAPWFDVEPVGPVVLKGKAAAVAAYRVLRPRAQADQEPGRPLVGREREMALLTDATRDLASGRGAIIGLIGEAGLGKSRLIAALRSTWTGESGRWLECRVAS